MSPKLRSSEVLRRVVELIERDRPVSIVLAGTTLASLAVCLPGAITLPLWQDEVASARVVSQPTVGAVLDQIQRTESAPPLWYLLAWLGHQAGVSPAGLRFISVVFAAFLAPLIVLYARRFMPLGAAAFAGLIGGVGWQFVAHGRELRGYALYALLALLFAFALERAARRPTFWSMGALALCVAAGLMTHYLFALLVLAGLLWLWTGRASGTTRLVGTAAAVVGAIPLILWSPVLVDQYSAERFGWISDFNPLKAAYLYGTMFDWGGPLYASGDAPLGIREGFWLAAGVVVLAGATRLLRRSEPERLCALLAVGPVLGAAGLWLAGPHIFNTRNLIGVAPFVAVSIASLLVALPRRVAVAGAAATLSLVLVGTVQGPPLGPPADRVAAALQAQGWTPESRIVLFGDFYGFRSPVGWYLPGRPFLRLTEPVDARGDVFVVAQGRETWDTLRLLLTPVSLEQVDDIYIARAVTSGGLEERLHSWGGYVLAIPRVANPS